MGRGPPGQGMPSPPRLPLGICSPLSPRTSARADGLLLAEAPGTREPSLCPGCSRPCAHQN